jgi:hypothetical protein
VCAGCLSSFEALGVTSAGTAVVATTTMRRVRERFSHDARRERRREIHRADSAFVTSLGLDADAVLSRPE